MINSLDRLNKILDKTEELIKNNDDLTKIRKIISNNLSFKYCRENAQLHDSVSHIAKEACSNPDLKQIWGEFLKTINGLAVRYPDGKQIVTLDFSPEFHLLETNLIPKVKIEIGKEITQIDKDVIWSIQNEAFGNYELPSRENFENWYLSDSQSLLTARDEVTGSILGFLLFCRNRNHLAVNILARKANAAKRGIGNQLMETFITSYVKPADSVSLCVRESHTSAQSLYRKFGFQDDGYEVPQKACPMERDLKMIRL